MISKVIALIAITILTNACAAKVSTGSSKSEDSNNPYPKVITNSVDKSLSYTQLAENKFSVVGSHPYSEPTSNLSYLKSKDLLLKNLAFLEKHTSTDYTNCDKITNTTRKNGSVDITLEVTCNE